MSEHAASAALDEAVREARQALEKDPYGELTLPFRRRIWLSFGPVGRGGPGHKRRAALDLMTAEHVLPLWHATQPDNDAPERVLTLARQIANGEPHDSRSTETLNARFRVGCDDLAAESPDNFVARDACRAASAALTAAQFDHEELRDYPPEQADHELYPDDWDASYIASGAVTDDKNPGGPEDTPALRERRRQFWRWYLDEAVPRAFGSVAE